jgi:hypothetical protein
LRLIVEEALDGEVSGSPAPERNERGEDTSGEICFILDLLTRSSRLRRTAPRRVTTLRGIDPEESFGVAPGYSQQCRQRTFRAPTELVSSTLRYV